MTQNNENKILDILSVYCNVEVYIDKRVYSKVAKQIGLKYSKLTKKQKIWFESDVYDSVVDECCFVKDKKYYLKIK